MEDAAKATATSRNSVQFEAEGWYIPVKSQKDMTTEEKTALWWQRHDYADFQQSKMQELQFEMFEKELQQQKEEYELKMRALQKIHEAKIAAIQKSKNIEICRLKAAKRLGQAQCQTQPNIQAMIMKQELLQQRDYYEGLVDDLKEDNQKLRKTIDNMLQEKEELTDVIRAREVDRARNEVCALQAKLAEQSQQVNQVVQNQLEAKDEALFKAQQEIAELRWQLKSQSQMHQNRALRCPSPGPGSTSRSGPAGMVVPVSSSPAAGATTVGGRTA